MSSCERRGPWLIAHGAGNSRDAALAAIPERPDFLEADLWLHHDRLELRHERAAYPLPLLIEKWYLRPAGRSPFCLQTLLAVTAGSVPLLLDLKTGGVETADALHAALSGVAGLRVSATSQSWSALRAIGERCPGVDLFYSIDVVTKLDLFLSVCERDRRPRGVSCRHNLLTPTVVEALHSHGVAVIAWTVDDRDRALELASWGVDGITTHRVAEIREVLAEGR